MDEATLKRDLALACRILGTNGHEDSIFGHVSARLPGWDRCWMKGHLVGLAETTEDDLLLIDFDGKVLEGKRRRHSEYPIHTEIMRARPEILSVVHTHPVYGIAFAARGLQLRPVSHEGSYFWPPGVPIFEEFTDLVQTRQQGEAVSRTLGGAKALFLRNHGIAVADLTIQLATFSALMLERASQVQLLAQPAPAAPFAHTPEAEAVDKRKMWSAERVVGVWDFYVRKLEGR